MTYISEFTNATSHMHDYFAVKKSIQSGFTRLPSSAPHVCSWMRSIVDQAQHFRDPPRDQDGCRVAADSSRYAGLSTPATERGWRGAPRPLRRLVQTQRLLSTRSTRRTGEAVCSRRRVLELGAVQIGYQLGPSKSGASVRSPLPCCLLPGAGSPQTEQSLSLLQVWR